MKRFTILLLFVHAFTFGQELLFSSYKYSDGISYIPSMAGIRGGALITTYRSNWSGINGAPTSGLVAGHANILQDKIGVGGSLHYEKVNFIENYFLSIPVDYKLPVCKNGLISFGIAPQLYYRGINTSEITNDNYYDDLLQNPNKVFLDFTFATQFSHKYLDAGFSLYRFVNYASSNGSADLVLFANGYIPIKDEYDLLEPSLLVQIDNNGKAIVFASVYYKILENIIVGLGYHTSSRALLSVGLSLNNRWIVGYNYEKTLNATRSFFGDSQEITLRFNLNDRYYNQRKFSSLAHPREGMSTQRK